LFVCFFSALGQLLLFQILAVLLKNTADNPTSPVGARSFYKRPVYTVCDREAITLLYHSHYGDFEIKRISLHKLQIQKKTPEDGIL